MYSTSLSRFTDDLISEAVEELEYDLDFKSQSADEKVDTAQIKRSYDVSVEETGYSGELLFEATIPTDSASPHYELKISGLNKIQDQVADEIERQSLGHLERVTQIEEGEFNVIDGYISEDVWMEYLS
jgi:hypothetical protein